MSDYVPEPWTFVLLALASWRVFLLIASDKILEHPIDALLRRVPMQRRDGVRDFLECPRCLGFWLSAAWWLAWLAWPTETSIFAAPWAIAMVVALGETVREALAD